MTAGRPPDALPVPARSRAGIGALARRGLFGRQSSPKVPAPRPAHGRPGRRHRGCRVGTLCDQGRSLRRSRDDAKITERITGHCGNIASGSPIPTTGRDARTIRPPPTRLGRIVRAAARGGFAGAGRRSQTRRRRNRTEVGLRRNVTSAPSVTAASPAPTAPHGGSGPGLAPRPEPDRRAGGRDRAQPPEAASQVSAGPQGCKLTRRPSER